MATHDVTRWHRAVVVALWVPALVVLGTALTRLVPAPPEAWLVGGLLLALHGLARRYPVRLAAADLTTDLATSVVFAFALLLTLDWSLAVLGLAIAAFVPVRAVHGAKPPGAAFEVARAILVYGAAGATVAYLQAATAGLDGSLRQLIVALPAGLVAYLIDTAVVAGAAAVKTHASPLSVLRQDRSRFDLPTHLLMVALAPAVVVLSEQALLLTPLLLIALVGLNRSSTAAAAQQHAATHDGLTGLANRRQLERKLASLIADGKLRDRFALLLMDLDRFKEVNDSLGHHVGDELLTQLGARLATLDGLELAARIGGDEFAFVRRGVADHAELLEAAQRVVGVVSRPYVVADVEVAIGASVGIALFPDHGLDGPSLLRRADSAMYSAKRSGVPVGVATIGNPEDRPGRVSLLSELPASMRRGELSLDYQPKVSLRDGQVHGMEALLRWNHPEHGLVPPGAFISTVEHTELIAPLTRHVLELMFGDVARWVDAGVHVPVAANISTRDLQDTRFPRELAQLLEDQRYPAGDLTLEITETALQVDPDRARQVLLELRELGVKLSIDDFGTGYSSLSALRVLPVHELKIDRSFIRGMEEPGGVAIIRAVVELAHALDLWVVAEGVEDEDALWELQRHGCDSAQGFLLSRPLPGHLVAPWVRTRRAEVAERRDPFTLRADRRTGQDDGQRRPIRAV